MPESYDLLCLSHLRWDFVFQRPQHLLSRFERGRVFFVEEPVVGRGPTHLELSRRAGRVTVAVPHVGPGEDVEATQRRLLDQLLEEENVERFVRWHYTPLSVPFSRHLRPLLTVYDCMDELSHFKFAPPELRALEKELFGLADLVFTGGQSLYEFKRDQHPDVHAFPSSVDVPHFSQARRPQRDPEDQSTLPPPRAGYFGVIDERIDLQLLADLARLRPDLSLVMVGPVCKIDPADLPEAPNLHYLGGKTYRELPAYLAGWDVALMPFARNEATRFISPTKTPEYLAGGKPVVSTSIQDVVRPYQALGLVHIADDPEAFAQAIDAALAEDGDERQRRADDFLATTSWDRTWARMQALIDARLAQTLQISA